MSTDEIFNYVKVSDRLSTAGQPTAEQLHDLAADGFTAVINLATYNPGHSLADEGRLVGALGMAYVHIPVEWGNPTDADYDAFEQAMSQLAGEKLLIHCAANFRATAFYGLYAHEHRGWSAEQAAAFRTPIWAGSDYPIWEAFIAQRMERG
ncbi:protein of unknown function [Candidatus Promineifilum breve]|uniref:Beta-lactamase hydrolase-like protein phosphatase-like domain-containing protein n=1 Tax=Candidatus Promineifilum breve TaxID=1806508 RepID=A0A160T316_9CHLR|nr:protein tyrosine phosphatase family protein [Candidatus Promineifilum breve]CUS04052.2 protein of unknown function [Candidatus Promineifilum breve]